jgi:protein-tyrosine phosphatase
VARADHCRWNRGINTRRANREKAMIRTSETDLLQIASIGVGAGRGKIGVTFAPGKNDLAIGGPWARDLEKDLDAILAWGAKALVTLLEPHELALLAIPRLGAEVRRRGIDWLHMPIRDVSTPDHEFDARWSAASERLRSRLDAGENIVVHCRGGLGRAGMIAARLLVETGSSASDAIARVRAVRPGAIETIEQEDWVRTGPISSGD